MLHGLKFPRRGPEDGKWVWAEKIEAEENRNRILKDTADLKEKKLKVIAKTEKNKGEINEEIEVLKS